MKCYQCGFKFKVGEYQPCEVYVFVGGKKSTLYVCPKCNAVSTKKYKNKEEGK